MGGDGKRGEEWQVVWMERGAGGVWVWIITPALKGGGVTENRETEQQ